MDTWHATRKLYTMLIKLYSKVEKVDTHNYKAKNVERFGYKITITKEHTWLGRLFKIDLSPEVYIGNYNVWYKSPELNRSSILITQWLYDLWSEYKYIERMEER